MNENIAKLQQALGGLDIDGDRGPKTTAAILLAADQGRLQVVPGVVVAPITDQTTLPWLQELKAVWGLHEVHDHAKLLAWLWSDGHTVGDPAKLPWCGDAVETAIRLALPQEPLPGKLGANPYFARNWEVFGVPGMYYGSVGVFERGPTSGHVGFLIGQNDANYFVFGGNQGDKVGVVQIDKGRLITARWPTTWPAPGRLLPVLETGTIPLSVNEV